MRRKGYLICSLLVAAFAFGCGEIEPPPEEELAAEIDETFYEEESGECYVYYLHTDRKGRGVWKKLGETFSRRTGIPVTVEYVNPTAYEIRLQQVMAEKEKPTAFLLRDEKDAYIWEDYTIELSETDLGRSLRYPSEYLFYRGKASGIPDSVSSNRKYVALNADVSEASEDATEKFFLWAFCSAEGRMAFPNRGYADCYQ